MKRKTIAILLLVMICLVVLVVKGVSQPPPAPSPAPPQPASVSIPAFDNRSVQPSATNPAPNFAKVEPQQQEWTFEQLAEALKGVRARQKELKTQEAELLAKMAEKVEEKRKDLNKAEEVLQQLRGELSARTISSQDPLITLKKEERRFEEKKGYEKK